MKLMLLMAFAAGIATVTEQPSAPDLDNPEDQIPSQETSHKVVLGAFHKDSILYRSSFRLNNATSSEHYVQLLESARFIERTPDFTDLYMIHTKDKGRKITIYCSASHCYKRVTNNVLV